MVEVLAMRFSRTLYRCALSSSCCLSLVAGTAHAEPVPFDLLRLLTVDRPAGAWRFDSPMSGYVRFWVERGDSKCAFGDVVPEQRDYSTEKRDWFSRLFWGRNFARVLQAKLTVTRSHVVTQSVTLAAASHASNGHEGENWSSELGNRQFLTPFFRVDQGTTAQIDVTLSATKEAESAVTKNVLAIVQAGAKLGAPTGPLVTALNSDRLNQASNFVDTAIARLFHEKIEERSSSDFSADRWLPRAAKDKMGRRSAVEVPCAGTRPPIASIRGFFPMGTKVWSEQDYRLIGTWNVYVSDPIVSIFSDEPLLDVSAAPPPCPSATEKLEGPDLHACHAFRGLAPTRVLSLPVDDKVTFGEALRANAGINAAVQRYAGLTKGEDKKTVGREICNLVAERADAIGLNQWDSAAAVWAFAWNGGLEKTLAASIWDSGCLTASLGQKIGLAAVVSRTAAPPAEGGA